MNQLREFKLENEATEQTERRRGGIKLVAPKTPANFRIEVADDLFSDPARSEKPKSATAKAAVSADIDAANKAFIALAAAGAVVASGLLLRYLFGRRD